jgi:formate dehydrogenase major subunit
MGKGAGFGFQTAEEIWEEVRRVWPGGAGVTYRRLEGGGLQWPCPDEGHPGTDILHVESFAHGPRATLRCVEPGQSGEVVSTEYPFLLVTGRDLYQFNAGTMSMRTENALLRPHDLLELSPEDAARLGLRDGERARIESRHGHAILPVLVRAGMHAGEVFATFHTAEAFVNRVTGSGMDPITHTPEYKRTAIRIVRA